VKEQIITILNSIFSCPGRPTLFAERRLRRLSSFIFFHFHVQINQQIPGGRLLQREHPAAQLPMPVHACECGRSMRERQAISTFSSSNQQQLADAKYN
jgi:hypothetical protein